MDTTIRITLGTRAMLEKLKSHRRETMEEVVCRLAENAVA